MSSKKFPDCIPEVKDGLWKRWRKDVQKLPPSWYLTSIKFDEIYHLACPASPPRYQADPGTDQILRLASSLGSRVLFTSTSEIYGEPQVSPQPETYRGNVNCTGIRACYDEGKRAAEALMYDYHREHGVDVRVARIFNTFGPHMDLEDGRVVTNFIRQMLTGEDVTIYGDGSQSRSFCYVDDMVEGLIRLMESDYTQPVNLGNPDEIEVSQLMREIRSLIPQDLIQIRTLPLPEDDPTHRCPDISLARKVLGWEPKISRLEGLRKTIAYAKLELGVEQ